MSYEGHIQLLCVKGHPATMPAMYSMYGEEQEEMQAWRCRAWVENKPCGEKIGWSNSVDDTNCESHGHREMIQVTPQITKTCDLGHPHVWTAATYKPSENPFWFHQELGWMEMFSISCPECGELACKSVQKTDPPKIIIDCGECHNRRVLAERQERI